MTRKSRSSRLAPVDVDRRPSPAGLKLASKTTPLGRARLDRDRRGLRELDDMTRAAAGLNARARAKALILPEDRTPAPNPRTGRPLPQPDAVRGPLPYRQRRARRDTTLQAQQAWSGRETAAVASLLRDSRVWDDINTTLGATGGDIDQLAPARRARVKNIDAAIAKAEKAGGGRGHIVYVNVRLPDHINRSNAAGYIANVWPPGETISLDRYSAGTYQLHEAGRAGDPAGRTVCLEIETRRGAPMTTTTGDHTGHLLPRGLSLAVVGTHAGRWSGPAGHTGERLIIQCRDAGPKEETR